MSDLYQVEVSAVDGSEVELVITIVHPDIARVYTSHTFVFSLLADPLRESPWDKEPCVLGSPLAARLGTDRRAPDEEVERIANGIVRSARITAEHLHPPPDPWSDRDASRAFWDGDERPVVHMRVTVSHPAWLAHLRPGMHWRSAAYSVGDGAAWPAPGLLP